MEYASIKAQLIAKDPKLEQVLSRFTPKMNIVQKSDYRHLIKIIIGQQLSGSAARTIYGRLIDLVGNHYTPARLLRINATQFSEIGISRAKANYARLISEHLQANPTYFSDLKKLAPAMQIEELLKFKGVGIWTASIFTMTGNLYADIFAHGDATLNKVIANIYELQADNFNTELPTIIEKWTPYKTLVCHALWSYNDGT